MATYPNPLLDPEAIEDQTDPGLLRRLGGVGLSGVAAAGNLLDLPGSMIRDVLGLHNPFDNLLNPFSSENRTSGRELLRQYGLVGQADSTANWWGGLAAEIATDPLTYASFGAGALTKAGKVAQVAGALGDAAKVVRTASKLPAKYTTTLRDLARSGKARQLAQAARAQGVRLADVADEPLANLLQVGVPGTSLKRGLSPQTLAKALDPLTGGRGLPAVETVLGGMDKVAGAIRWSAPGRTAAMLFDRSAGGVVDELGQRVAAEQFAAGKQVAFDIRRETAKVARAINQSRQEFRQIYAPDITAAASQALPGASQVADSQVEHFFDRLLGVAADTAGDVDEALRLIGLPIGKMTPELRGKVVRISDAMQKAAGKSYDEYLSLGGVGEKLEQLVATAGETALEHFPRYASDSPFGASLLSRLRKLFTRPGSSFARQDELRHLPREIVNQIVVDPAARERDAAASIAAKYGKWLGRGTKLDPAGQRVPQWATKLEHAEALAEWVRKHERFPIFNNSILQDWYKYEQQVNTANLSLRTIHDLVAKSIGPGGRVTLKDVFRDAAKMDPSRAADHLANVLSKQTGQSILPADVLQMKVPEEVAQAIAGIRRVQDDPDWLGVLGGAVDELTNFWKQNVTLPFPSYWTRNHTGGQFVNMASGLLQSLQDVREYIGSYQSSWKMLRSLDADALSELFVEGVVNPNVLSEGVEMAGGRAWSFPSIRNPLDVRQTFREVSGEVAAAPTTAANPLLARAGQAYDVARTGYGALLRTGEKVSALVEFMNRAPMYFYLKNKGWNPRAAAEKVLELQIDYSALTPFERNVAKRLVPFWSWHRGIAPVILGTLGQRPGGLMGQSVRASRLASSDDPSTPEWLSSTLAIENPLGSNEPGGRSYITGFGLPYESPLGYFGGGLRGAGREFLSQLNPLLKAPLEWSTGQSFFQTGPEGTGRPLGELNPPIGQTLANIAGLEQPVDLPDMVEFAAANSPLSRYMTTARQVTDPRKSPPSLALNLLTGVRVSDVSPGAQDAILRQRADALLKEIGGRTFTRTYVPEQANLSSAEQGLAEQLAELKRLLDQRSRARRAELAQPSR